MEILTLFSLEKKCCAETALREIEEAERAGNISRLAVNGISVYEHGFADAVLESIESQGYIVMELGRSSR